MQEETKSKASKKKPATKKRSAKEPVLEVTHKGITVQVNITGPIPDAKTEEAPTDTPFPHRNGNGHSHSHDIQLLPVRKDSEPMEEVVTQALERRPHQELARRILVTPSSIDDKSFIVTWPELDKEGVMYMVRVCDLEDKQLFQSRSDGHQLRCSIPLSSLEHHIGQRATVTVYYVDPHGSAKPEVWGTAWFQVPEPAAKAVLNFDEDAKKWKPHRRGKHKTWYQVGLSRNRKILVNLLLVMIFLGIVYKVYKMPH